MFYTILNFIYFIKLFLLFLLLSYPLSNLSSFSSSLEQYKQSVNAFDGLEANPEINQFLEYDRLADRPAWVIE